MKQISHTNVIICTPTYKLQNYTNIYNWRIETFNNLLYLDILSHEHAYFLDCNCNLNYDHTMFDLLKGRINNYGLRNIFENLLHLINDITISYMTKEEIGNSTEEANSLFFRF